MVIKLSNGFSNGFGKKALKSGISASLAIFFSNVIDPGHIIWSLIWWRHILLTCAGVFIFTELLYLKNWLDTSNGNDNGNGSVTKDARQNLKLTP